VSRVRRYDSMCVVPGLLLVLLRFVSGAVMRVGHSDRRVHTSHPRCDVQCVRDAGHGKQAVQGAGRRV